MLPVSLTSQIVTRVCFDYAVNLLTEKGTELKLESPFIFRRSDAEPIVINPERPGAAALEVLSLLHAVITRFEIQESGSLALEVEGGSQIRSEADANYEAWTIAGRYGEKIVCLPADGGLAIWGAVAQE